MICDAEVMNAFESQCEGLVEPNVIHGKEGWKEKETLRFYSGVVSSCFLCKDNFINTNITKHKLWWKF